MPTYLNRREVLAGLLMSVPTAATLAAGLAAEEPSNADKPADKPAAEPSAKPRVAITISRETTYITEPLRADGYPDYVAALNQRCSQGVTPENNAAVPFWRAMGPGTIDPKCRKQFFQMLGIPPLPEKGEYFIAFDDYVEQQTNHKKPGSFDRGQLEEHWRCLDIAKKRPWSKQEFPVLAEWLAINEKPLALAIGAFGYLRRYDPVIVTSPEPDVGVLLHVFDAMPKLLSLSASTRERPDIAAASTLVVHAMSGLHEGKVNEAWEELLACHRLGRLAAQRPTLVDGIIAVSIERAACIGDRGLLQHANLTPTRIEKMRKDLAALSPLPKVADRFDGCERWMALDAVCSVARHGVASMGQLLNGEKNDLFWKSLAAQPVDWNQSLRMINSWFDRAVVVCRDGVRPKRLESITAMDADLRRMGKEVSSMVSGIDSKAPTALPALHNSEALSRWLGQMFLVILAPPLVHCLNFEDEAAMRLQLTDLAFALAAYRTDHGSYPEKLADVTPKYITRVPKDIFNNDADLHYLHQGDGYLLYSVGINGRDNGGREMDDYFIMLNSGATKENEPWDDLTVRVPAMKP